jgi:phosphotransferase system HPr-like phosphotransfer protein
MGINRRQAMLLSFGFLVCLAIFAGARHWQQNRLPRFQGRTAGEWFLEFRKDRTLHRSYFPSTATIAYLRSKGLTNVVSQTSYSEDLDGLLRDPVADGLRGLGTNAVPFLEAELNRGDSRWSKRYRALLQKTPATLRRHLPQPPGARDAVQRDAALALSALGTNAASAVPALIEAYQRAAFSKNDFALSLNRLAIPSEAYDGMLLRYQQTNLAVGVEAVRFLRIRSLTSAQLLTNAVLRGSVPVDALAELQYHISYAQMAMPALSAALKSPYRQVQESTLMVLRRWGPDAKGALPTLQTVLKNGDGELRYQCMLTLEAMGPAAASAVEAINSATNDPNPMVQHAADRVLKQLRANGSQ